MYFNLKSDEPEVIIEGEVVLPDYRKNNLETFELNIENSGVIQVLDGQIAPTEAMLDGLEFSVYKLLDDIFLDTKEKKFYPKEEQVLKPFIGILILYRYQDMPEYEAAKQKYGNPGMAIYALLHDKCGTVLEAIDQVGREEESIKAVLGGKPEKLHGFVEKILVKHFLKDNTTVTFQRLDDNELAFLVPGSNWTFFDVGRLKKNMFGGYNYDEKVCIMRYLKQMTDGMLFTISIKDGQTVSRVTPITRD